jgi:hypothetical protein
MASAASLKNLKAVETGSVGKSQRSAEGSETHRDDRHEILVALAAVFDQATQRAAIKRLRAALTTPRTVLKAVELAARINGELGSTSRRT